MDQKFRYSARVRLELADGTSCQRFVRGFIDAADRDDAERQADDVIRDRCLDFGGDDVEAPVEHVEVLSVRFE